MHNDGTGPQYDRPARQRAAIVEYADGSPVEYGDDGLPILTERPTTSPDAATEPDEGFEPADQSVGTVQAYLTANPEQTKYVLDRERAGKARVTLLNTEES